MIILMKKKTTTRDILLMSLLGKSSITFSFLTTSSITLCDRSQNIHAGTMILTEGE